MSKQSKRHMGANIKSAEGVDAITVADDGNVGIGTASPAKKLHIASVGDVIRIDSTNSNTFKLGWANNGTVVGYMGAAGDSPLVVADGSATERMRIDANGNLLVGNTARLSSERLSVWGVSGNDILMLNTTGGGTGYVYRTTTSSGLAAYFLTTAGEAGRISCSGNSTTYSGTSDYRLKENVKPMVGALSKVAALKPVTYKWKFDGSEGEGFIAHELAEVCSAAVVGEKDAVNEDGSIKPQGIDPSKLVGLLTAAIQELKAELDEAKAEIAALRKQP